MCAYLTILNGDIVPMILTFNYLVDFQSADVGLMPLFELTLGEFRSHSVMYALSLCIRTIVATTLLSRKISNVQE